jgi:SAM-dependent methyltransferase
MDDKELYREKLEKEKLWYSRHSDKYYTLAQKFFRSRIFYSFPRILYSYKFPKQQLSQQISRDTNGNRVIILDAPCGRGNDVLYIENYADTVLGIDISFEALSKIPDKLLPAQGDLLNIPFPPDSIDVVVCPLFFHHMLSFGFDAFLREFFRILRPGGKIYILEPSVLYPLNLITRPIKKWGNNPYGEVEDERPFHPCIMLQALENIGFQNVDFQAATFSHPAFYIPLANFINKIARPLLKVFPFKYFGWLVLFKGMKPSKIALSQYI